MKAARINEYGDVNVIQITETDKPTAHEGQVLVEVRASSINPFDSTVRAGYVKDALPSLPITLGGDVAGEVIELGEGVNGLAVGDNVYGQAAVIAGNSGAFAEFAATKASQIAKMPSNVDYLEAASLPLVGVSALQALTEHIDLQPNQKLFIHGGGGGIGTMAIQIAKNIGAYVATTATGQQIDLVTKLGADEVIDYKSQDFADVLSEYDAVFDAVGGSDFVKAFGVLKQGGVAVTMIAESEEAKAAEAGITAIRQMTHVNTDRLNSLRELVENGVVTPQVDKVFSLDDIQEAFKAKEEGMVSGKVVLKISDAA
jgi:alcohol dehydrogenase